VSAYEETNVRLPPCAFDALAVVVARRETSRDETVRQLLSEHVERQEQREVDDRLTHISTVLRYPPPPRWRSQPRADKPLRLRLAPGLIPRAQAVSLRLPGQSQRAHRDYQGRLLTDAVVTAIAVEEPFTDGFLQGMLPLLRHRAALGLWKLVVAATTTRPERAIHYAAEEERASTQESIALLSAEKSAARHHLLLVAEALEEDVSWHSAARFQVAANIARDILGSANSRSNEQMLYEQGNEWGALRQDLLDGGTARDKYLRDIAIFGWIDWIGRGGSAVWRAERRVSVQDFEDWLIQRTKADPVERVVSPPGWLVRVPSTWRAHAPKGNTGMPEPYATWVAEGLALVYPYKNRQAVWPLIPRRDQLGWQPVPGIESVISAAQRLRPDQVVGFIEAVLLDWSDEEFPGGLSLPADKACDFGFITAEQQRQARAEARAQTLQAMDKIIDGLSEDQCHLRPVLEQAKGNTQQFRRIAKRLGIKFTVTRASWPWPGRSVVDEVTAGTRPDLVEWLAKWAYRTSTVRLEQSMEEAWHDAFDPHRGRRSRRM
jgi:hypothetical protein